MALYHTEYPLTTDPVYELVLPETGRLLAEAETAEAIVLAAATIRGDGENVDHAIVLRAGEFDPTLTLACQEDGLVT